MEHDCISPPYKILVVGNVSSQEFHATCRLIQEEYQMCPNKFHKLQIKPLFEYKWLEYLCAERKRLGKPAWRVRQPVIIYVNGSLIGDLWALVTSGRKLQYLYKNLSENEIINAYEDYMFSFKRQFVYMDMSVADRPIGRLIFMLYSDELPDTCGHFADLCSGKNADEDEADEGEDEVVDEEAETVQEEEGGSGDRKKSGKRGKVSMVWEKGEWRRKAAAARRSEGGGRCTIGDRSRRERIWEELKEIIEMEVERICLEEEGGEKAEEGGEGADEGGEAGGRRRARSWYRERKQTFEKWKKESLLRVAEEWKRREKGAADEAGGADEVGIEEGVVHVGGIVMHEGKAVVHVQGVVMPQGWDQGGEEEEEKESIHTPDYVVHVGGVVMHEGEGVVHVQGLVDHGAWEPRQPKSKLEVLEPGHVVHVGGIAMHEGKAVVHVQGIVVSRREREELALEPGHVANVGGIVMHDGEGVVHVQGIVAHDRWDTEQGVGNWTLEQGHVVHVGRIVMHDGESLVQVEGIVVHDRWELGSGGDIPALEPGSAVHVGSIVVHEGQSVMHVERIVVHDKWDDSPKEEDQPWPEPGHVVHVGRIVVHDGESFVHVEGIVARESPEPALPPGHVMQVGGIVVRDGESVVHVQGIVMYGGWDSVQEEDTWERIKERGTVEHVGGIVTLDGRNVRYIQGVVSLRDDEDVLKPKRKPCYKGSKIHRIVRGGWIQGGEINPEEEEDPGFFPDESFSVPFNRRGVLAMAREKHHTNSPQFIVTLEPTPWMRCEYVAFGQLVEGENVLEAIEKVDTYMEAPETPIVVSECGILRSSKQKRSRRSEKTKEIAEIPTEIFIRNILKTMMSDVAAEMAASDRTKFCRLIRNAVTVESMLEVMNAIAEVLLSELEKENARQQRRMSQKKGLFGIGSSGIGNFCGK